MNDPITSLPASSPVSGELPTLRGLVLAGGFSRRMRQDKGAMDYHGVPQVRWCHDLLAEFCASVHVSVRVAQVATSEPEPEPSPAHRTDFAPVPAPRREQAAYRGLPLILDRDADIGPASGLLAAWHLHQNSAWLALAADMPLVTRDLLALLVRGRDPTALATAFRHADGTLEPLCAIWEPDAGRRLAESVAAGKSSLRRLLEGAGVRVLEPADPAALVSINRPEEDAVARARIAAAKAPGEGLPEA